MYLPIQAASVNRANRMAFSGAKDVKPAFLGTALYLLGKAGVGAVKGVLS